MKSLRYTISLRITHPTADLAIICRSFDAHPSRIWRAGEARATPKGRPLKGVYDNSYCVIGLDHDAEASLAESMLSILKRLQSKKTTIAELISGGGKCSLFIGWFSEGNSGESFDWTLLKRMTALKLSLELDVYC